MVEKSAVIGFIVALMIIIASAMSIICLVRGSACSDDKSNRINQIGERMVSESRVAKRLIPSQYNVPLRQQSETNSEFVQRECVESLTKQSAGDMSRENAMQIASDKNQVMDRLLSQPQIPTDYSETMIALFRDSSQDVVTRDFAVRNEAQGLSIE